MRTFFFKTTFAIAAIFSFRMLGLFFLIPVFTLYANNLQGATPALIGLALGGYGLTQGLLQIPFGMLSDTFGRKPIITLGLILFACGSLLGALTDSITGMILARILQGTGAVGSVLMALLADLIPDEQRTKAMAVIGMAIGSSFSLAMVLAPAVTHHFGLASIFYLTAVLAISGILLLHLVIPTPLTKRFHVDMKIKSSLFVCVIKNKQLQILNLGIFCQHFILTATFFVIPLILKQQQISEHWHFYLPLMCGSFIGMLPFIFLAEKKQLMQPVFVISISIISISQLILAFTYSYWLSICAVLFAYFVAFNILEALLPSQVSKQVNSNYKGSAMGIYSTAQFLGIFAGGSFAGLAYQFSQHRGIFMANALLAGIWGLITMWKQSYSALSTLILPYTSKKDNDENLINALLKAPGVNEVAFSTNEQIITLRLNQSSYQIGSAEEILKLF